MNRIAYAAPAAALCLACILGSTGCATSPTSDDGQSQAEPSAATQEAFPSAPSNAAETGDSGTVEEEPWYAALPRASWSQYEPVDVSAVTNWFKVYKAPGNVYAIYDDSQWEENICYLVIGSDKALLVDTSMGLSSIKDVVDELTDLPVTVLLTHTHHDHMGGMHEFDDVWCFDSEQAIERCTTGLDEFGDITYELEDDALRQPLPAGIDASNYRIQGVAPTNTVKDGDVIDLGNRQLKVFATPGHTGDSICLVDAENHLLFTGDTYYPADLFAFSEDADLATYAKTMDKLVSLIDEYQIEIIYTGHNEIVTDTSLVGKAATAMRQILEGEATEYEMTEDGRRFSFPNDIYIITADVDY